MFYLLKKSVNKVLLIIPCYGWRNRGLEKFDISKVKLKVKWPKWDWIKIWFFSRFQALNDGYIQHCQLSATSMKSRLNGPSKKGTDSLVELINKLPGEIHTQTFSFLLQIPMKWIVSIMNSLFTWRSGWLLVFLSFFFGHDQCSAHYLSK